MLRLLSLASVIYAVVSAADDCPVRNASIKECTSIKWIGGDSIEWPCPFTKNYYKDYYNREDVVATRIAISGDTAFLAFPRYKSITPITLGKLSLRSTGCEASITPFPSWTLQEPAGCSYFQNVVDIFIDHNNILWALDDVVPDLNECLRKVVAIDIRTGEVLKRLNLNIPSTVEGFRLQNIVADYANNGDVFIYVSDPVDSSIFVYNVTSGHGHRFTFPESIISNNELIDPDHLLNHLNLALIRQPDGTSYLLFTYVGGTNLFAIKTNDLQSEQADRGVKVLDLGSKKGRDRLLGTDNRSAIFLRKENESDIYRWDLDYPCEGKIRKVYEGKKFELPFHVVPDYNTGRMRVLESNFPDSLNRTVGCGVSHAINIF